MPVAQPPGQAFEALLNEESLLAIPIDHRPARDRTQPVALKELDGERPARAASRRPDSMPTPALCAPKVHVELRPRSSA